MKPSEADFCFPLLGITQDRDLWGFPDFKSLTKCGPRTLRDDMQAGMELIDTEGRRWRVASVRSLGRYGSIPGRWLRALLSPPQFKIEQDLEPIEPLSLAEVLQRACEAMEAHPEFWCDDPSDKATLARRLAEVRAATSIAALHEVLGLDTFESY